MMKTSLSGRQKDNLLKAMYGDEIPYFVRNEEIDVYTLLSFLPPSINGMPLFIIKKEYCWQVGYREFKTSEETHLVDALYKVALKYAKSGIRKDRKFRKTCLIRKNTVELERELKMIGYVNGVYKDDTFYEGGRPDDCIVSFVNGKYYPMPIELVAMTSNIVDCGDNEELFIALASLRDDRDCYQWFTDGVNTWERQCDNSDDLPSRYMQMHGHKATEKEIMEFFTKDKIEEGAIIIEERS